MGWWGKVIGGAAGWVVGGPLVAALGVIVGDQFDRSSARYRAAHQRDRFRHADGGPLRADEVFLDATFAVMGHVAKIDGRVSEPEIGFAEATINQLGLDSEQRQQAIARFREGKRGDFPLIVTLDRLRAACAGRHDLLRSFLELQLRIARADGRLHLRERNLLQRIRQQLGISRAEYAQIEALVAGREHRAGAGAAGGGSSAPLARRDRLRDAYRLLGLAPEADETRVKRAYRQLMSQHHPDKLVARGASDEKIRVANQKTQEIREAYELIRRARGIGR